MKERPRKRDAPAGRPSDLVRLVYVSASTRDLTPDETETLAATCRRNNLRQNITGLLLLQDGFYYALMEGRQRRVMATMERIITDPRHNCMQILREEETGARRFENWSFAQLPGEAVRPEASAPSQSARFLLDLSRRLG